MTSKVGGELEFVITLNGQKIIAIECDAKNASQKSEISSAHELPMPYLLVFVVLNFTRNFKTKPSLMHFIVPSCVSIAAGTQNGS